MDNLLVTSGGEPLVQAASGQSGLTFQGNDYWPGRGQFVIRENRGSKLHSLDQWRAAGQESAGHGISLDPQLVPAGAGKPVANVQRLSAIRAYRLRPGSPLVGAGMDLHGAFGFDPGPGDFYGTKLPPPRGYGVGAAQS